MRALSGGKIVARATAGMGLLLASCSGSGSASSASPDAGTPIDADGAAPDATTADPTPWKSGARLRAMVLDGGEGAKLFDRWHDTVLRVPCSFATAVDGRLRCLPIDEEPTDIAINYSDPDCTHGIALGPPPEIPYVRIADRQCGRSDDNAQAHHVRRWGSVTNVDVPYVLRGTDCMPITNAPVLRWYNFGEAPPEQFVAAEAVIHATPDGQPVQILVAEDGSRENARLVDKATLQSCEVLSDHVIGAPDVCVPFPYAVASASPFSAGPTCDQAIALAEPDCSTAFAGLALRRDGCKISVDVVELGDSFAPQASALFRRGRDGICRSDKPIKSMIAYPAGRLLPWTAFSLVTRQSFGSGRLQTRLRATSDGLVVRNPQLLPLRYQLDPDNPIAPVQPSPFEFYDTVRRANCRAERVADGTMRCIPADTEPKLGRYFEDASCSQPVQFGSNDPACPSTGFASLPGWAEIGLALPPTTEIRPLRGLLPTAPYTYAPDPQGDPTKPPRGTCIMDTPSPDRVFYALGDPIPVPQLPYIAETTE